MFQELLKIEDFQIFWAYAHNIMGCTFFKVQFMQFPVLHFGLAHSGSWPFNYKLPLKPRKTQCCYYACLQSKPVYCFTTSHINSRHRLSHEFLPGTEPCPDSLTSRNCILYCPTHPTLVSQVRECPPMPDSCPCVGVQSLPVWGSNDPSG